NGRAYVVRLNPYRTDGRRDTDGVVMTFVDVTAIKQTEAALRDSEKRLENELDSLRRLHQMTLAAATAPSLSEALEQILTTAVALQGAQFGTVQLFDEATGELRIAAQHGFSTSIGEAVASIERHEESACGRALRRGATVRVSDIEQDAAYVSLRTGNK